MKRNALLLLGIVILSSILSVIAGDFISKNLFPYGTDWIIPSEIIHFTNSFPIIYLFLIPLIFILLNRDNNNVKWIIFSSFPIFIIDLYIGALKYTWLLSIKSFLLGLIIALIIKKIFIKNITN
ncbi:MAG: hypothetical protein AAB392_02000 [Patescibacteria group bacterium]